MAFPAAGGATFPLTLEAAWSQARSVAQSIQQNATTFNSQISSGGVSALQVLNNCGFFATLNAQLTTIAATPGLAAYAQAQVNNPALDVAGAFTTVQNALVAVITWIATNFPASGVVTFNASGQPVWTNFSAGQLAALTTLLTALSATIA